MAAQTTQRSDEPIVQAIDRAVTSTDGLTQSVKELTARETRPAATLPPPRLSTSAPQGLDERVRLAFTRVLGVSGDDPAALARAVQQRFPVVTRKEGEARGEWKESKKEWTVEYRPGLPLDLSGSGGGRPSAQRLRLRRRSKGAFEQALEALDALRDPDTKPTAPISDDLTRIKTTVRRLIESLRTEFNREPDPRAALVEPLFEALLTDPIKLSSDGDTVKGQLGLLAAALRSDDPWAADISDEEQAVNLQLLFDQVDALAAQWKQYQEGSHSDLAQRLSRIRDTAELISEAVQAWRDAMTQAGFGPEQQRYVSFDVAGQHLSAEDAASLAEQLARDTVPALLEGGSRFAARPLQGLAEAAAKTVRNLSSCTTHDPFDVPFVRDAAHALSDLLDDLRRAAEQAAGVPDTLGRGGPAKAS